MRTQEHTAHVSFGSIQVDSLNIQPGERYDLVFHASLGASGGNHWVRLYSLPLCSFAETHAEAILRYAGAPEEDPPGVTDYATADRDGDVSFTFISVFLNGDCH